MTDFAKVLELPISQLHAYLSNELQMNPVLNIFAVDSVADQPCDRIDTKLDEELEVRRLSSAQINAMKILQLPLEELRRRIEVELAEKDALAEPDINLERLQTGEYRVRVPESLLMQLSVHPRFAELHHSSATNACSGEKSHWATHQPSTAADRCSSTASIHTSADRGRDYPPSATLPRKRGGSAATLYRGVTRIGAFYRCAIARAGSEKYADSDSAGSSPFEALRGLPAIATR